MEEIKKLEQESINSDTSTSSDSSSKLSSRENLMQLISISLMELIANNKSIPDYKKKLKHQKKCLFSCKEIPKISIGDYLHRFAKYSKLEESSLILSLIYIYIKFNYYSIKMRTSPDGSERTLSRLSFWV